jgi:hypothetical protein
LFGFCGAFYAIFSSDFWAARQPLVVRDSTAGAIDRLGRFGSSTELKAAQETILDIAQNPEVVAAALRQIGPPGGGIDESWPSTSVVDEVASSCVNIRAPKGSEFGDTEVIYLEVKAKSAERVALFCDAMLRQVTEHHRTIRRIRADSIIVELEQARDLARRALDDVARRIQIVEVELGSDLGELRNMSDTVSSDGTTRRTLEETDRELQAAELELERHLSLYELLVAGSKNPNAILVSGGDLLSTQPSLQRLKDGLIDAQLATSRLSGNYTTSHPKHRASVEAEKEIRNRIQEESLDVIQAMQPTLALDRERVTRLKAKQNELSTRLTKLADVRTSYSKLDAELRLRTTMLGQAETALAEAQASRSAALKTHLIAELGPPQVNDSPTGPSGMLVTLGASMSGLIFGLGIVFLVAPGPNDIRVGRRWSDYLTHGRRTTDSEPIQGGPGIDRRRD